MKCVRLCEQMQCWLIVGLFLAVVDFVDGQRYDNNADSETEPAIAILFPAFITVIGGILHYALSRTIPWFPYTAAMFLVGTLMGVAVTRNEDYGQDDKNPNLLHESIVEFWMQINGEVLLLSFLPGLIYSDAAGQNTHLFQAAFVQCLIFAFPMVLAGTALTALVAYYIFDYDWSISLCMTFGAILSATDPVAVAALLNEVGAPPRLKVHVAGESLLNDGSAIVFYAIFSSLFLLELNVPNLGEDVDFALGVKKFVHMALGGAATGIFFGLGLLASLTMLNRRLNHEENVTEVALTFAMAYACYFTAEIAWGASGVISVVALGVMTTAFGTTFINDMKLWKDFWSLIEWFLNTILFALGGLVWGSVISERDQENPDMEFSARDWGYLFLLYILLMMIRLVLFSVAFSVISRIGLKTHWKELVFQSFGGLRGAVGIALALSLDEEVTSIGEKTDERFAVQTRKLFGLIGGIAFLTLCINGVLARPLLKKLGLTKATDIRERIVACFRNHARQNAIHVLVQLLSQRSFKTINLAVVKHHVPILEDVTMDELAIAVRELKKNHDYGVHPDAASTAEHLGDPSCYTNPGDGGTLLYPPKKKRKSIMSESQTSRRGNPTLKALPSLTLKEVRLLFLELVRSQYAEQINNGELADSEFVAFSLNQALDMSGDAVSNGESIRDWDFVRLSNMPLLRILSKILNPVGKAAGLREIFQLVFGELANGDADSIARRVSVERCISFISAHSAAQNLVRDELATDRKLSKAEEQVVAESEAQVEKAEEALAQFPASSVGIIVSHKVCKIILQNIAEHTEKLSEEGILKPQEAEEFLSKIQQSVNSINTCTVVDRPSELVRAAAHLQENDPIHDTISLADFLQTSNGDEAEDSHSNNRETDDDDMEEP